MNLKLTRPIRAALWMAALGASSSAFAGDTFSYRGLCDASAAVALRAA